MSENVGEHVPFECPSCSPDLETVHEVLTTGGGNATVKCTDCGHVHKEPIEEETTVNVDVVVSQDGESFTGTAEFDPEETIYEGDEFVVETEEVIAQVRVTSIEAGPEDRTTRADAADVDTVWTREVGNVSVDITINPKEDSEEGSRSIEVHVPGDYEFAIGEAEEFGEEAFTITGIHVRENAIDSYKFPKLGDEGDMVFAKDVKRVYGDDETSGAWSPW